MIGNNGEPWRPTSWNDSAHRKRNEVSRIGVSSNQCEYTYLRLTTTYFIDLANKKNTTCGAGDPLCLFFFLFERTCVSSFYERLWENYILKRFLCFVESVELLNLSELYWRKLRILYAVYFSVFSATWESPESVKSPQKGARQLLNLRHPVCKKEKRVRILCHFSYILFGGRY